MQRIRLVTVDAFTRHAYAGNPAAVCLGLQAELPDRVCLRIAAEMNLSETAFVVPLSEDEADAGHYRLRWFTPTTEVPLCGHGTLAAAHALYTHTNEATPVLHFHTRMAGTLVVRKSDVITTDTTASAADTPDPSTMHTSELVMDLPLGNPEAVSVVNKAQLATALGLSDGDPGAPIVDVAFCSIRKKLMVRLADVSMVLRCTPDAKGLQTNVDYGGLDVKGVIVGACGDRPDHEPSGRAPYDYCTRYFAPWVGIPEDPVTGSAHTVNAPYFSTVLGGKKRMHAHQASARGGSMWVELVDDGRILLQGSAVTIIEGSIPMPRHCE